MKSKSRLSTLRRIRALVRDDRRRRLAEALEAETILNQREETLAEEINALESNRRLAVEHGSLDVGRLADAHRYEVVLGAEKEALAQQTTMLSEETERRRVKLAEADSAVRAIEKMEEKRIAEEQKERHRLEMRELDEIAGQAFLRKDQ